MNYGSKILTKLLNEVKQMSNKDYNKLFNSVNKKCIFHKYKVIDSRLSDCGWFEVKYKCKKCGKVKKKMKF